jgi:ABC-type transport system involved in multi-copper enzyme maturation permease subunit
MTTPLVRFLNIIVVALLAGVSFGIWIGFNPSGLSATAYLEQQQNMLYSLRSLLVFLVVVATLITLISAYLQRNNRPVVISLVIAAILLVACILITRFGNKPIDDLVITWTIDTMPDNWTELRNKWWSFHILRTIAEIIALFLITWTSINKNNGNPVESV